MARLKTNLYQNIRLGMDTLKADSHELCLMHADAADSCVSAEIGIFQFFCTAHFCQSSMCQTQLV